MAYEIPKQLKYKEKFFLNLTFHQVGWLMIFSTIVVFIMRLDSINFYLRLIISIPITLLGIGFIYLNFKDWIYRIIIFFKFKLISINSLLMGKYLGVQKIENNSVYLKSKRLAIIETTPINFSIKNDEDKEAIVFGFRKFLNSLDFPIQFVITTNNLSITEYLDELKSRNSNTRLFNDFFKFMQSLIKKNKLRNRRFFLVITEQTNLDNQTQICIDKLRQIGILSNRLNDKAIIKDLHLFFNDITDKNEYNNNFKNNSINYLIAPNKIENFPDYFKINEKFCRIIAVKDYPNVVESGFLDKIISTNEDFDISIHIMPYNNESSTLMLNNQLNKQKADLFALNKKQLQNRSLDNQYGDTQKILDRIQRGQQRLFEVSLYINCKSESKKELDLLTAKVKAELNSVMMVPHIPYFRQLQGYKSIMPVANDQLKIEKNITTKALGTFIPYTSTFLDVQNSGVMLGLNRNKVPVIKDIFKLSNANGVVLATSGSGKSYFTKLLILRQLLSGTKVMVIDPQSEYHELCNHVDGTLITISRYSESIINPLDLMGQDLINKRLMLMDLFKVMFGELSEAQKTILDRAIVKTYKKYNITDTSYKNVDKMPILKDLYQILEKDSKKSNSLDKISYQVLLNRLYMYTDGVFKFFNRQTNLDFDNDFVCFDIGDMPEQVEPVAMFLVLDYVYKKMKQTKERKLLIVDEAWSLLSKTKGSNYIFVIVKTCRKSNLGLLLITQDVLDLLSSKAGKAVLNNSSYTFLLRQKTSVIPEVMKTFHLSSMEKEYLLTANKGKGILIMDNDHQELEVIASPIEHDIVTTNADEIISKTIITKTIVNENEFDKLNLEKGLFKDENLTGTQKNYLINNGYEMVKVVPVGEGKYRMFWVKKNKVESLEHTYFVYAVKELLEKTNAKDIQINIVKDADLTFRTRKGVEVAVEVETGIGFMIHKPRLKKKFQDVRLKYNDNVILLLIDSRAKRKYQSLLGKDFPVYTRADIMKGIKRYVK